MSQNFTCPNNGRSTFFYYSLPAAGADTPGVVGEVQTDGHALLSVDDKGESLQSPCHWRTFYSETVRETNISVLETTYIKINVFLCLGDHILVSRAPEFQRKLAQTCARFCSVLRALLNCILNL